MSSYYKNELKKRLRIIVSILFEAITIIILLFCFYLIDYVIKFLGFENEIVAVVINEYIHPIMLMSFFVISMVNIFKEHLPKNDQNTRFELIYDDENER